MLKNYNSKIMTVELFIHIFEIWGLLSRISISKKHKTAFIQYFDQNDCDIAYHEMNDFRLFDAYLSIVYVDAVDPKYYVNSTEASEEELHQSHIRCQQMRKYGKKGVQEISRYLCLSNVSEYVSQSSLQILLGDYVQDSSISCIRQISNTSFLLEFANKYEAIKVFCQIQGVILDNNCIHAEFINSQNGQTLSGGLGFTSEKLS